MGKVAIDIFEAMRNYREYNKEKHIKSLNIVKVEDDISETLFKMFEQMRLLNEDLNDLSESQMKKKQQIREFE